MDNNKEEQIKQEDIKQKESFNNKTKPNQIILIISIVIIIALIVLLTFILNNNKTNTNSTGSNTATGKNPYSQNESQNNTPANLEKNIVSTGYVAKNGRLIVIAGNNNTIAVDMEIEVEFYDKDGTIVGSDRKSLDAVGAKTEIAIEMYSTPSNWDNYKIYIDVEQTNRITYYDKVEIKHSNANKQISVQVTNNSSDIIDEISIAVVFYQGEEVVGLEDNFEIDIKPGRSANFNISYPHDKGYNKIGFDSYKVFLNEVYSYNW